MQLWKRKSPLPGRSSERGQEQRRPRASTRPSPVSAATGAAPTVLLRGGSRVHCLRVDSSEVATRARTPVVSGWVLTQAKVPRASLRQGWWPAEGCARSAFGRCDTEPRGGAARGARCHSCRPHHTPCPPHAGRGSGGGEPAARRAGRNVEPRVSATHRDWAQGGQRGQHPARTRGNQSTLSVKMHPQPPPCLCVAGALDQEGAGPRALPPSGGCSRQPKQSTEPEVIALRPPFRPRCLERRVWVTSPQPRCQGAHAVR
uniref:Uncharacterized protein n=1 Tax=Peromyscus maniculatus bairdii TaxID=230844 RepID=A0A8C8UCX2_PERMB